MKSEIIKILQKIVAEIAGQEIPVFLEIPQDPKHGDYTTNVAMSTFAKASADKQGLRIKYSSPLALAEEIVLRFKDEGLRVKFKNEEKGEKNSSFISHPLSLVINPFTAEAAAPGFINFWLSKEELVEDLELRIMNYELRGEDGPLVDGPLYGKKIMVEFTDPNPFKEFHIGHLYSNTVGESLCKLLESQGAIVWRADYYGDVGMHVAKSLWGMVHIDLDKPEKKEVIYKENLDELILHAVQVLKFLESITLKERIKFLGQAYALGSTMYEESERAKDDTKHLSKLIFIAAQKMWQKEKGLTAQVDYKKGENINEQELEMIYQLYTKGRQWSLEYFDSIYTRLGMHFDGYYPESIAGEKGYVLVKQHIQDGIFEESDGAIVFPGEKENLHTRVFINSLGFPTYEAKELGLAPWKYEEFPYDFSIIVTGSEINEYFKVLLAALSKINPELGKKTKHISHGMVRLPQGKMSSRTGKILTGEWLLDEAAKKVMEKMKSTLRHYEFISESSDGKKDMLNQGSPEAIGVQHDELFIDEIAEQVAVGAIKYAFLKNRIGADMEFNIEESVSFEGNSGPYIQYTYARTQSILSKDKGLIIKDKNKGEKNNEFNHSSLIIHPSSFIFNPEELLLLRKLYQFSSIIEKAGETYSPNIICEYLFELSQGFNNFYQKYRIIDAEGVNNHFRLALTQGVGMALERGLSLLGIAAPKRM